MPVRVRTARLRSRLDRLQSELPRAVDEAIHDFARYSVGVVQERTRLDWGGDRDQIGFDVDKFNRNIDEVEPILGYGWGILNVQRMGTVEDYEAIFDIPGLWHMGHRMGDSFRRLIYERPSNAAAIASARNEFWGDKTPQWWFKEYGNVYPGAYPSGEGTHTIDNTAFDLADDVQSIVSRIVNEHLRSRGILI